MSASAIDFQWVGGGFGARDLVMVIASSMALRPDNLANGKEIENAVLQEYFKVLKIYIEYYHKDKNFTTDLTLEKLQQQYEFCMLDYVRFMVGWSLWGNTNYAVERTYEILNTIDNGKCLSPEEYREVLRKKYCN